ncbi:unnamed protein product (macronuclear) [Paramecium tetraurelia]|uniref:Uncharacterized protein n=1 Tax=Paramecium tetraurelia TaxID=5888 RepID=A0DBZ9_PARTE|nr:uncharacterized protein GSPATT00015443001 [Paramecium tetraurelia]CAK80566.1 unnamed protein product [Paramecium tetraurelia]|eukprot:XP_001447963.1 hypothetical protein (macronuclear) [Paramecium tetraurelia strain d4-2]
MHFKVIQQYLIQIFYSRFLFELLYCLTKVGKINLDLLDIAARKNQKNNFTKRNFSRNSKIKNFISCNPYYLFTKQIWDKKQLHLSEIEVEKHNNFIKIVQVSFLQMNCEINQQILQSMEIVSILFEYINSRFQLALSLIQNYIRMLKKLLILIASLNSVFSQTIDCAGMIQTTCTAAGYCFWTGTACRLAECHKVSDIRACRSSLNGFLVLNNKCAEIPSINSNFLNQCMEFDQTTMMYSYVKFPSDITQLSSSQTTGGYLVTTIMTARYTSKYKYEIVTVNILTASTSELMNIMNAYIQMQYDLADTQIHPMYLEKAIYESMQAIRDDVALTLTGTTNKRQDYYTLLWRMTDAYFLKLRAYQPFYISNKYLINSGFSHFNRFSLTLGSQYQTTQISWTSYNDNGYLELLVIPAEQFGILSSLSDIFIIRPSNIDGSDATLTYSLQWTWSYTGTQPTSSANLYTFDKIEMNGFTSQGSAGCNTSTKTCTINISSQSTTKSYLIAETAITSQVATGRYYTRCRLGRFTWSGTSCA